MKIKRMVVCFFMIILISCGASLTLKAAIGVGAWDALALTGSSISGIKVGTVGMLLNFICIFIELMILRKNFKIKHALQIALCIIVGYTVNFFFYNVLGGIELSNYFIRVVILIVGYIINAFTVAVIMLLDVVTFALEGACMAVSNKVGIKFHILRQGVDVVCIVVASIVAFTSNVPLAIREGTVIGMVIFGPIMGLFMKQLKPIFQKYDLSD